MTYRNFLTLSDAGADGVAAMLADVIDRKAARASWPKLRHSRIPTRRSPAARWHWCSRRTRRARASASISRSGSWAGIPVILDAGTSQLGRGETIADTARVLSGYCDAIMVRTDDHTKLLAMAESASVPVINGLTDFNHPCQIMADLQTILESGKALPGFKVAWLGDGNNVLASFIEAAGLMHFDVVAACPQSCAPSQVVIGAGQRARA